MPAIQNTLCLIAGQSQLHGPADMRVRVTEKVTLRRPATPSVAPHNRSATGPLGPPVPFVLHENESVSYYELQ